MNVLQKLASLPTVKAFTGVRLFSAVAENAAQSVQRTKHRIPQKKASKLLNELKTEEFERLKSGRKFPEIKAGDSVEIHKLPHITSKEHDVIKGVVIGITNRANDTAIKLLNMEYDNPVYRRFVLYSPMIKDIKILQRAFIHKGKKRVRRSKLYYLAERHPDSFTVL